MHLGRYDASDMHTQPVLHRQNFYLCRIGKCRYKLDTFDTVSSRELYRDQILISNFGHISE